MLTRRAFCALGATAGLAACARPASEESTVARAPMQPRVPVHPPLPAFYGAITDEPFPIPAIPEGSLHPAFWRQEVANPFPDRSPGTIVVDPDAGFVHLVQSPDTALRYGCSVGAAGYDWEGTARLQFTRAWPRWNVPEEMAARRPELRPYTAANGGMDPGPGNPLGARALYLFQNGVDTLYRIHGNATPSELGRAVSAGCIRLLDQDAIDIERRAVHGADVVVLPSFRRLPMADLY